MNDLSTSNSFSPLTYSIRYIGCLPIRVSIKTLDFNTRTVIARECIHRVCEDAKLKVPSVRPTSKDIASFIDDVSDLRYAMTSVRVTISLESLVVEDFHTGSILFSHPLGSVSFASAGDNDMLDFVSYVAKVDEYNRMCYVFQCSNGVSHEFITSMGQAFRLAYQGFKTNNFTHGRNPPCRPQLQTPSMLDIDESSKVAIGEKSKKPQMSDKKFFDLLADGSAEAPFGKDIQRHNWPFVPVTGDNFDDAFCFNSKNIGPSIISTNPTTSPFCSFGASREERTNDVSGLDGKHSLDVSDRKSKLMENHDGKSPSNVWPPRFPSADRKSVVVSSKCTPQSLRSPTIGLVSPDSRPPASKIMSNGESFSTDVNYLPVPHPLEPVGEPWYLGCLSRQTAESLLQYDGDFLVRASSQQPGQFVLSGLQDGKRRHLLLVNPEGQVRTRDRIFTNIQNLIDYHLRSGIPIRSADSELKLAFPVSLKSFDR